MGIFYGGHGQLLLCQFISVVVTISWSVRAVMRCHVLSCSAAVVLRWCLLCYLSYSW